MELKIPPGLLDKVIAKVWPNTRGKWTMLRATFGLSPWGHMGSQNTLAPEFRFIKSPRCNSCRREEWRGHAIPLNESGMCLNCAAVRGITCAQIDTSLL
jgi:hypothetical protein